MKNLYITIQGSKQISLKQYVSAWKTLKRVPLELRDKTTVKESLCTWYPVSVSECLEQYTQGIHDRINIKAKNHEKLACIYQ